MRVTLEFGDGGYRFTPQLDPPRRFQGGHIARHKTPLFYRWTCPLDSPVPHVSAARVASHRSVFCMWRGGKGGHGRVCR